MSTGPVQPCAPIRSTVDMEQLPSRGGWLLPTAQFTTLGAALSVSQLTLGHPPFLTRAIGRMLKCWPRSSLLTLEVTGKRIKDKTQFGPSSNRKFGGGR